MAPRAKAGPIGLDQAVIAAAVLEQFDTRPQGFSIRPLADSLGVSPSALYYYFPTRSMMIAAAVDLVWDEVFVEITAAWEQLVYEQAAIVDFLVASALCTRRTFDRHFRIARFISADMAEPTERLTISLAALGAIVDSLGVPSEEAGAVIYSYNTYVIGSVVLVAGRRLSREMEFHRGVEPGQLFDASQHEPSDAPASATPETLRSLEGGLMVTPTSHQDEAFFEQGLRFLISGWPRAEPVP